MPPARIVIGPLHALEDALAHAITAARREGGLSPVTVLVGNVLLRPYLRRTLAQRGVAQLNVRYARPNELAALMAEDARAPARPRLSPAAERLLVREIAEAAGGYFAPVAGRDGFAEALQRLFREIELGAFTAASLRAAFGDLAADPHAKEAELAVLYESYEARRRGFVTASELYASAATATLDGPLLVYGLWSPTRLQSMLIERIAAQNDVTVFLPASGIEALDHAHAALRDRLVAAGANVEQLDVAAPPLARSLFAPALDAAASDDALDVRLINAPDTVREIWEAARACLRWAADGIRFHEMAVVYRNREPYRALIDEIFSEAGIETYLHDGRLLSTHPLGRRLIALLELAARHETFARAEVMEFLTETELPRDTAAKHGRFRPSEWESYTREAGVVEGIAQWEQRLGRLAAEKRESAGAEGYDWLADVAGRIDTLIAFARELHDDLAARPEDATWAEHLAYLRRIARTYAANLDPLLDALGDLETLAAVRSRATFDLFRRAVRDDLESRDTSRVLDEPVRLFGRQGVAVIDASSLRHLRFRAVCLVGVAERAWPPPPRPDPLLLERERRRLNEAGGGELPLRTEPDEATLSFWLATQSAREHLRISFARADAGRSGKHLPSYFFRAVAEALEGRRPLALDDLDTSDHVRRFEAGRLATSELAESLSAAEYDRGLIRASYERGLPGAVEAVAAITPAFGRAVRARSSRRARAFSEYDGVMFDAAAQHAARESSAFQRGSPVSASRLEMYTTCPYRYFLRYALGIQPVEEPETTERIDHLQRGSLIHEILQVFLSKIGRDDPPRIERRPHHLALLMDVAAKAGEDRVARGVTGRPLIWKMDKQQIDDDLTRWYDAEVAEMTRSPLRPGAFEARFGPAWGAEPGEDPLSSDAPLELLADGRTIKLQGRIDRIDWDDGRLAFRVIDYKTGKYRMKKDDVFRHGESLQLPIYLHAAAKLTGIDPTRGEAQYFHVSANGEFKRHIITGDELLARSADFERILTTIAGGVDDGYFGPNPGKNAENCKWCDYKDVCDRRIDRIMEKKSGDPRGDAFRSLEEIE